MLGPSTITALEETGGYQLVVSDIGGSPALRDPDQVQRLPFAVLTSDRN